MSSTLSVLLHFTLYLLSWLVRGSKWKKNGSYHRAPSSPPKADYSPARRHRWMLSMSQLTWIETTTARTSFGPNTCCSKLKLLHHCHPPRCRVTPRFPRAATRRAAVNRAAISRAAVKGDTVRGVFNTTTTDRDGGGTTPRRRASLPHTQHTPSSVALRPAATLPHFAARLPPPRPRALPLQDGVHLHTGPLQAPRTPGRFLLLARRLARGARRLKSRCGVTLLLMIETLY